MLILRAIAVFSARVDQVVAVQEPTRLGITEGVVPAGLLRLWCPYPIFLVTVFQSATKPPAAFSASCRTVLCFGLRRNGMLPMQSLGQLRNH